MRLFAPKQAPAGTVSTDFCCRRDGLALRGVECRPTGSGRLPAAIVCHGFMANQSTVAQYTQALAGWGYAAYRFDFNGGSAMGSKSEGKTTDMPVLTEVADLEAVLDHVKALPYIDKDNILLMGCSQGGFVAALTAAKHSSEVAKLALFYPALCIPDDARAGSMMMAKFDPANVPQQLRCGPMRLGRRYVTDVLTMDPFAEIVPYTGPVLIVHGTQDSIVAPDYARRAYAAYQSRPQVAPVTLRMIAGGGHGFGKKHDAEALRVLQQFVQRP